MRLTLPKIVVLCGVLCAGCQDGHVQAGDRLAAQHRWREAVDEYKAALARYPHDYDAAWGIARIYCHAVKTPDKCLAWTSRLLLAYPDRREYRQAAAQGHRDSAASARAAGHEAEAKAADRKAQALEARP
jgi:hypothetical protein